MLILCTWVFSVYYSSILLSKHIISVGLATSPGAARDSTCLQIQMQLVSGGVEGPVQFHLYLEGLPSTDDHLIPVIQVCVVLHSVLAGLGAQKVDRLHQNLDV